MIGWLKCTSLGPDGKAVYVNMDLVISVIQRDAGARLIHGSGNASYIDVIETADEIFRAAGERSPQPKGPKGEKRLADVIGNTVVDGVVLTPDGLKDATET